MNNEFRKEQDDAILNQEKLEDYLANASADEIAGLISRLQKKQEEAAAREKEEREALLKAEKKKKDHIRKVTSMDLPSDWESTYAADEHVRGIYADNPSDGLILSLNNLGRVDIEYIAAVTGKDCKSVIGALKGAIYQNPDTWNECFYKGWETSEEYLSGDLKYKWEQALKANEEYEGYFVDNLTALESMLSPSISYKDIYITLGSPWVPTDPFCYDMPCRTRRNERMKRADIVHLPAELCERMLSVIDSEYMRNYLREEENFTIYDCVDLIGSAPRPMDDKLNLLRGLRNISMDSESLDYLEKSIRFAETAMNLLYRADPGKTVILVHSFDSASPDPVCMGTLTPCRSYQDVLDKICSGFCDEDRISLEKEDDFQDYYFTLELYQLVIGRYIEQCTYYCTPNGKIQYFRMEYESRKARYEDREQAALEEIFCGREGLMTSMTPYQPGDILYVDMLPWYRPTYCIICWISPDMPYDCCGIQCLYPTFEGMIGEAALKHGYFLPRVLKDPFDLDRVLFCPLYRAVPYEGDLPEAYGFMKPLSEKLKTDPSLAQKIDDLFMEGMGKNCAEIEMVYRPTRVERPDWKDGEPETNPIWIPGKKNEREWWEDSGFFEGVTREQLAALMGGNGFDE